MANLWNDVTNQVMRLANLEADRYRHEYIGTQHLLLALLRLPDHAAARALAARGIVLLHVRRELEEVVQHGREHGRMPRVRPLTPRAKAALEHAVALAHVLGKADVDSAHLLAGVAHDLEGVAGQILRDLGFTGAKEQVSAFTDKVNREPPEVNYTELPPPG
jgi:ATP-dependent Clp protease ATP-binding subunit ClpC